MRCIHSTAGGLTPPTELLSTMPPQISMPGTASIAVAARSAVVTTWFFSTRPRMPLRRATVASSTSVSARPKTSGAGCTCMSMTPAAGLLSAAAGESPPARRRFPVRKTRTARRPCGQGGSSSSLASSWSSSSALRARESAAYRFCRAASGANKLRSRSYTGARIYRDQREEIPCRTNAHPCGLPQPPFPPLCWPGAPAHAWEPTKPVEIVVAAGAGGASDQMARDDAGRDPEEQPDEAAGRGIAQGRRLRCRGADVHEEPAPATRTRC